MMNEGLKWMSDFIWLAADIMHLYVYSKACVLWKKAEGFTPSRPQSGCLMGSYVPNTVILRCWSELRRLNR